VQYPNSEKRRRHVGAITVGAVTGRSATIALAFLLGLACMSVISVRLVEAAALVSVPITQRHADVTRELATERPHKEEDQKIVDGWPMYRTDRGQEAFNRAMATMAATDQANPPKSAFRGCRNLACRLKLPKLTRRGWIPEGRLWVSPREYVLFVQSPRSKKFRRRSKRTMKYFIFHEFHNSTRNTDVYDTVSAHKRSVFVPFYLGKEGKDAAGNSYVVVIQTAPHNVISRHASNLGSRGPGIEVAKNKWEKLTRLQASGGLATAAIVEKSEPQLKMLPHRFDEGKPMLNAYRKRLKLIRKTPRNSAVRLPFVPARSRKIARAKVELGALISRKGVTRIARKKPRRKTTRVAAVRPAKKTQSAKAIRTVRKASLPKRKTASRLTFRVPAPRPAVTVATVFRVPAPQRAALPQPTTSKAAATPKQDEMKSIQQLIERILSENDPQ